MICLLSVWGILKGQTWETIHFEIPANETAGDVQTDQKESGSTAADVSEPDDTVTGESTQPVEAPKIALTFDDGPNPGSTPILLDGLKERGVKVTFFVIGQNVEKYPDIVKREAQEGHIVGNHTYHHVEITKISADEAKAEIMDTSNLVEEITGIPTEYMRPPFGAWQKELELGMDVMPVLWNVDPLDWTTENEDEIVNKVVTQAKENDIILLHDCYKSSVNAALRIIDILQKKGFEFVTVDELLLN